MGFCRILMKFFLFYYKQIVIILTRLQRAAIITRNMKYKNLTTILFFLLIYLLRAPIADENQLIPLLPSLHTRNICQFCKMSRSLNGKTYFTNDDNWTTECSNANTVRNNARIMPSNEE